MGIGSLNCRRLVDLQAGPLPIKAFSAWRYPQGLIELAGEWSDARFGEGGTGLDRRPPRGDAWMALRCHLVRRDLLVDALHERYDRDVGDGIGVARQPFGLPHRLFHPVEDRHQL